MAQQLCRQDCRPLSRINFLISCAYIAINYLNTRRGWCCPRGLTSTVIIPDDSAPCNSKPPSTTILMPPARWPGWNASRYARRPPDHEFFAVIRIPRALRSPPAPVLPCVDRAQIFLVRHGFYRLPGDYFPATRLTRKWSAWTYRKVNETDPYPAGYAPLGVEGGIAKEQAKMTLLWQELEKRNIPIGGCRLPLARTESLHDQIDSRQVRIWRDWCEGKCKRFVSLFPAFFAAKNECPWTQRGCWYLSLFLFGDHHYNTAGNTLIADEVIKSLEQDPPITQPPDPQFESPRRDQRHPKSEASRMDTRTSSPL